MSHRLLGYNARSVLAALAVSAAFIAPAAAQTMNNRNDSGYTQQGVTNNADVVALRDWNYNDLYARGWSAKRLMDEAAVIGANGEEIGSVENLIIGGDGKILGLIAQVGGFWDIGDTHVFVPWDEARVSATLNRVRVPITEDNVDDYSSYATDFLRRNQTKRTRVVDDDLGTGIGVWKATDLIDDYSYLSDDTGYGYINDLIFTKDGELRAVVVNPSGAYGGGYRALPFYGYGYGWRPGAAYYNMPYTSSDLRGMEPFEYNRMQSEIRAMDDQPGWNNPPADDSNDDWF